MIECSSNQLTTRVFTFYDEEYTGELQIPDRLKAACDYSEEGCPVAEEDDVGFLFTIGLVGLTRPGSLFLEIGWQCDDGNWFGCARIEFVVIIDEDGNKLLIPGK